MVKKIIFDLDGTLVNTLGGIALAANHVLESYGHRILPCEQYKHIVGNGMLMTIYGSLPLKTKQSVEIKADNEIKPDLNHPMLKEYEMAFADYYRLHPLDETMLYDGINELIRFLNVSNIKWGIHTNKDEDIAAIIANHFFGGANYLGLVGKRRDIPSKPAIEGALELIGENYNKDEVAFVGDTEIDIQTGIKLEVKTVAVTWGFREKKNLEEQNPDYLVETVEELITLIKSWN